MFILNSQILQRFIDLVASYNKQESFSKYIPQAELAKTLDLDLEFKNQDIDGLFHWIERYLQYSVNTQSLRFNNRMWSGGNLSSILGEMTVALQNTSSCTYESAPVAVLMEQYMLDQMLRLVGFNNGEGQMTTGSSNANMIAMMIARNLKNDIKKNGLFAIQPLFAFVSSDAHYSFDKAANILGLGTNQLIKIPVDEDGRMQTTLLENEIIKVKKAGGTPFFIGATLGTTVRGAYDDIEKLVVIKNQYDCWLHGDGAWGGAVIVSDKLKNKLMPKVASLDSFTMDFHKMLGSSLMCNFLLINQQNLLAQTCANGDTSYIFYNPLDLGVNSLQCGRRVDSLKWFLDWKFYQKSGFANRVENYYDLITVAKKMIDESDKLELIAKRQSFNLCFHYKGSDALNKAIREGLYNTAKGLLSTAYIDDIFVFRFLLTHPTINKDIIHQIFIDITTTGDKLSLTQ